MDSNLLNWLLEGVFGIFVAGIAFFARTIHEDVRELANKHIELERNLDSHKLESEKRYAKEDALQNRLAAIHTRMDVMAKSVDEKLDKIYLKLMEK